MKPTALITSATLAVVVVCLSAGFARAGYPEPRECESQPPRRDGFAPADVRRLEQLLREAAAAVPRTRGDGCRATFDEVPALKSRRACWQLPDGLSVSFECPARWPLPEDQPLVQVVISLLFIPADYPAEGEILESTPDLWVITNPQGYSTTMIFGARRNPTVVERGTLQHDAERPSRAEDGYRGPHVASVSVTIVAVRTVSTGAAKQVTARFDRAAILKLLKAEQRRRREATR